MNTLSRDQFDILTHLERHTGSKTIQAIAEALHWSENAVEQMIAYLQEHNFLEGTTLTEQAYQALEPYRVKRAIFIAAGFGSRLMPITINTPKPLVRVNGKRIIDTLLDAVVNAGIEEIYIVRGYLGEQFDQLLYKYPTIQFIENSLYNEANNISSAMFARHLMQNAYVMEADLVLYNPALITKYQYTSNYLGVPVDSTDDWCFKTSGRVITSLQVGGTNCYHEFGLSYWNAEDGAKLCEDIKRLYDMPDGKQRYWDQAPLEYFLDHYQVEVRPCTFDDVIEIDSYAELKQLDKAYC